MSDCENCLHYDMEKRADGLIYGSCGYGHWRGALAAELAIPDGHAGDDAAKTGGVSHD